jgi:hypothetical protein
MPLKPYKVEYFAADNPGEEYPLEVALLPEELRQIREHVSEGLLGRFASERELLSEMYSGGAKLSADILSDDFKLGEELARVGIAPNGEVYVYFVLVDGLDVGYRAKLERVSSYLEDVWYPPMDDLLIVDSEFKWLLLLAHYGAGCLHRLELSGQE